MKTLTRRKSTRRLIFGILCLLPLLLLLFEVFRLGDSEEALTTAYLMIEDFEVFPMVNDFCHWLQDIFLDDNLNGWTGFTINYFCYLIFVSVFDLMFSFFLCMIDLFRSWMDKLGGVE